MEICDDEFARRALREIGYYRLSGYSYPYRAVQAETGLLSDNFIEGTMIEKVVKLYRFDQELRAVTGLQLAKIEIVLRLMISHELGRVDPYIHLSPHKLGKKAWDKVNVRPTEQYSEWLDKYSLSVVRSNEDSVIHYKKKYDAILPVWVAVHVLDWGGLRLLYGFARDEQRKAIAQQLNISESQLSSWLHCLNEVRNVCAHHGRLYSRTFPKSPMLTGEDHELGFLRRFVLDDAKEGNRKEKKGKCFAQFTIIQYLLSKMNLEGINDLPHLLHKFPEVSPVSVKDLGVPENWEELPLWNGDMYSCPPQAMSYSQG
ncbi:Abi family protein [Actinomyces bouchesdurhonensis]|nr:Abi family protein [Actinomyces bouchesdurhonensis]